MQYLICRNNQVIPAGIPCTIGKVSVRLCEFPHYVSVSVYVCVCVCLCVCVCVRQCPAPRVPHLLHLDLGGDRPSSAGQHRPKICRPQPLLSEPPHREHPPVSLKLDLASDGGLRLVRARVRDLVRGFSEGALVRELCKEQFAILGIFSPCAACCTTSEEWEDGLTFLLFPTKLPHHGAQADSR